MATKLSVNVNAIALLRNRRELPWPSVADLARIALEAGAHGITVHPRPDERHIKFADLPVLAELIRSDFPAAEFNIEGYPSADFIDTVLEIAPAQVTLVPDDPAQATSDHGWNFAAEADLLTGAINRCKLAGLRTSLFCDPDADEAQLAAARHTGADRVELYTGPYGATHADAAAATDALAVLGTTAQRADELGLGVNAGHDLTVANLPRLVGAVPMLAEVSIGHGLTADALTHGMAGTVRRFLAACRGA
ncbi:MAG: pyridoxine 5'-phosphate synthase [Pseudomonadota bacterium]